MVVLLVASGIPSVCYDHGNFNFTYSQVNENDSIIGDYLHNSSASLVNPVCEAEVSCVANISCMSDCIINSVHLSSPTTVGCSCKAACILPVNIANECKYSKVGRQAACMCCEGISFECDIENFANVLNDLKVNQTVDFNLNCLQAILLDFNVTEVLNRVFKNFYVLIVRLTVISVLMLHLILYTHLLDFPWVHFALYRRSWGSHNTFFWGLSCSFFQIYGCTQFSG
jgi:hypothetical protein